jgi:hypothetical protein
MSVAAAIVWLAGGVGGPITPSETNLILNGDFESGFYVDAQGDAIPVDWEKYETRDPVESSTLSIGVNGTSLPGSRSVHWNRPSGDVSGDWTAIRQDLYVDTADYCDLRLDLDVRVVSHDLEAGGWVTPAFEWPVVVQLEYTLASNPAQTQVWRAGWYLQSPGDSIIGPVDDPGYNLITYYDDDLVNPDVWIESFFDVFFELPDLGVLTGIVVGGSGWSFEGLVDNVRLTGRQCWKAAHPNYAPSGMPDFDQRRDRWAHAILCGPDKIAGSTAAVNDVQEVTVGVDCLTPDEVVVSKGGDFLMETMLGGDDYYKYDWCVPTAVANCLWWFDSKFETDPAGPRCDSADTYGLVTAYPPVTGDHCAQNVDDPNTPPPGGELIDDLAYRMDTDGQRTWNLAHGAGTTVADAEAAVRAYIDDRGLRDDYVVELVENPDYAWIADQVEKSEDLILFLSFTQDCGAGWVFLGGHAVTTAGVDQGAAPPNICLSDPYYDLAEAGSTGRVLPPFVTHPHPETPPGTIHNDAAYLSHDCYQVTPGLPNPYGGTRIDGYARVNAPGEEPPETDCDDVANFFGQNQWDPSDPLYLPLPCDSSCPVVTRIAYALKISPFTWKAGGWQDYAPSGLPDFDQKQDLFTCPPVAAAPWSYCGPTAVANSLWWFDSKFEDPLSLPPPTISDSYSLVQAYGGPDDHDAANVVPLIGALGAAMDTDGQTSARTFCGTYVNDMALGVNNWLTSAGLNGDYYVHLEQSPSFDWVMGEVEKSQDVVLLLGFWQEQGDPPYWVRVGGHYVTVAGGDRAGGLIAFSDPFLDAAESGVTGGRVLGSLPHLHPGMPPDGIHNVAQNVSHDVYIAAPSPSPGGIWGPLDYVQLVGPGEVDNFEGQNTSEEIEDEYPHGPAIPGPPIFTEVEFALAVSPCPPDADGDTYRAHCDLDCDDDNPDVYPGAPQLCDGINNDCSDPNWPIVPANEVDDDLDGYSECEGDCDDGDPYQHPGAEEVSCDGVDNDCDGGTPDVYDSDGDGVPCDADCNDRLGSDWAPPGETRNQRLSHGPLPDSVRSEWDPPLLPGCVDPVYDTIRSPDMNDFVTRAICLETDDSDTMADDPVDPPYGEAFIYLERSGNDCPAGEGSLGTDSVGTPRVGIDCSPPNTPPVVDAGPDLVAYEGTVVYVDAGFSDPDPPPESWTAIIDWDDGTPVDVGLVDPIGQRVEGWHVYVDEGLYTVDVCVTDNHGAQDCDSLIIEVFNVPPVLRAPDLDIQLEGFVQLTGAFAFTFTDKGALDTHIAMIDWGDGTPPEPALVIEGPFGPENGPGGSSGTVEAEHSYADNDPYTITVDLQDDGVGNNEDTARVIVTVQNAPPELNPAPDFETDDGDPFTLPPLSFNDPGTLDTHTAEIDWGDGTSPEPGIVTESPFGPPGDPAGMNGTVDGSHLYPGPGSYPVTVTVTDDDGGVGFDTFQVDVVLNDPVAAMTANPNPAACNQLIMFDATGSYHTHPSHSIVLHEWDFDYTGVFSADATGVNLMHPYGQFGSFTAALRVTDDNSPAKTDIDTSLIVVDQGNTPPHAVANGPYIGNLGEGLVLDGSGSFDPDTPGCGDYIARVDWTIAGGAVTLSGLTPSLTLADISTLGLGTHSVVLEVEDSLGLIDTDSTTLTIYENLPLAALDVAPDPSACDETLTFDASASTHTSPLHSIVQYEWDLDYDGVLFTVDADTGATPSTTHAYPTFGTRTAAVRVTDDNVPGLTDIATFDAHVILGNDPPIADPNGPYEIELDPPTPIMLDGSGSYDTNAPCDEIVAWEWDTDGDGLYGDHTGPTPLVDPAELAALGPGIHPIGLRVTDGLGLQGTAGTTLTLYENHPVAAADWNPKPGQCDVPVDLDGTASHHTSPFRTIVLYEWDLDDDGIYDMSGPVVPWFAPALGPHPMTLRVTDDNAIPKADSDSFVVDIENRPPLADPNGPYDITLGEGLLLDASGTVEPDFPCGDSIAEYQWDLNGDGLYDIISPNAVEFVAWPFLSTMTPPLLYPADPGTGLPNNPITLRVVDSLGEENLAGTTLTIYPAP